MQPSFYIIAGPNGAGKTTFAKEFLPNYVECLEFVNADLIAGGISPFLPEKAAIRAGRLMLERIRFLASQKIDFGFETTLAGKAYSRLVREFRDEGYKSHLYFIWVNDVNIALQRVADRVRRGGHTVPEEVVRRRYHRCLRNFFHLYMPFVDFWIILDNSTDVPNTIAYEESGELRVLKPNLYDRLSQEAGKP